MDTLRNSCIYHVIMSVSAWFSTQWKDSRCVGWMTNQPAKKNDSAFFGMLMKLHKLWCDLFECLHLTKLFQGSIFLHPFLFVGAAVVLAPLVPTMVVLGLICGGVFSFALGMGMDPQMSIKPSPINIYVFLYLVAYCYAMLTSVNFKDSLFPGLLTILFVMAFFLVTSSGFDDRKLNWLIWVMLGAGVLVSLYGFYQVAFPEEFRDVWTDEDMFSTITLRVYSTLENPNVLGEYFLLIIPIGVAVALTSDNMKKRVAAILACGMMGVCLVLTYSRGCYLGLLFAAAVFLVLLDRRFLILGVIAVALCPLYLPESVLSRFTSIGNMGDSSTSYRVSIWLGTLDMLKDYWFCGIGPGVGTFNTIYPEYAYDAVTTQHSHSLYLQIMCETGIVGFLMFVLMVFSSYRMLFTAVRNGKKDASRIFQIAGIASMTGFLVQSATDHTFYNYKVMMLFWVILALNVLFCKSNKTGGGMTNA